MPQVLGQRTTQQAATEARAVRDVGDKIALLEPDIAPLVTLMTRMKRKSSTYATKIEWLEDDYVSRWDQNGAATINANTASTTITVTDGTKFVVGQVFVVPRSTTDTLPPEAIRVTAIAANTLTVARAIGGVGLATIGANAPLRLIGTGYEEGGAIPAMKSTTVQTGFNYTQIFRNVVDFSKTNAAIKQYGVSGSDRKREQRKKMKEHKIDIGSAMLWGIRSESMTGGPTGKPLRHMGGLNFFIQSNVYDVGGVLDRKGFETFSRTAFRYGNKTKLLLAAPKYCSAINEWGNSFLNVTPGETRFGVHINRIQTAHGVWMLVNDFMLEDAYAGLAGFGHVAFSLDLDELEYRVLNNNGENRDTHFLENVIKDGRDSYTDEYLTEATMEVRQEKYHAKMINMVDYMA